MKPYTISAYWLGRRFVFVRKMTHARALFIGRHLWRLHCLGVCHVQVEAGTFPTTAIRTKGEPATRAADVLAYPWERVRDLTNEMVVGPHFVEDPLPTPYIVTYSGGKPFRSTKDIRSLLIEGERTNLAIWSEGKP